MAASDPARGSQPEISLRADYRAMEARRQARLDRLDEQLTQHAEEVSALLQAERDRADAADATEPVIPSPIEGHVPPPGPAEDLDQLAASSAMGSPAHLRWRSQHVPNSNPYMI